jgi:hypothetical protein
MAEHDPSTGGSGSSIEDRARAANRNVRGGGGGGRAARGPSQSPPVSNNSNNNNDDNGNSFPALHEVAWLEAGGDPSSRPAVPTPITVPMRRGVMGSGIPMEEFPTLAGGTPSGPRSSPTMVAGPAPLLPTAQDFPALKPTRKPKKSSSAKKPAAAKSGNSRTSPAAPVNAWSHADTAADQRKLSHVPLPLPEIPPASELAK